MESTKAIMLVYNIKRAINIPQYQFNSYNQKWKSPTKQKHFAIITTYFSLSRENIKRLQFAG
jgi:hypothetical protein